MRAKVLLWTSASKRLPVNAAIARITAVITYKGNTFALDFPPYDMFFAPALVLGRLDKRSRRRVLLTVRVGCRQRIQCRDWIECSGAAEGAVTGRHLRAGWFGVFGLVRRLGVRSPERSQETPEGSEVSRFGSR